MHIPILYVICTCNVRHVTLDMLCRVQNVFKTIQQFRWTKTKISTELKKLLSSF